MIIYPYLTLSSLHFSSFPRSVLVAKQLDTKQLANLVLRTVFLRVKKRRGKVLRTKFIMSHVWTHSRPHSPFRYLHDDVTIKEHDENLDKVLRKFEEHGLTLNPLRPNNDLSQTSHCNIKGLSVSEVMRIENKITHSSQILLIFLQLLPLLQ